MINHIISKCVHGRVPDRSVVGWDSKPHYTKGKKMMVPAFSFGTASGFSDETPNRDNMYRYFALDMLENQMTLSKEE